MGVVVYYQVFSGPPLEDSVLNSLTGMKIADYVLCNPTIPVLFVLKTIYLEIALNNQPRSPKTDPKTSLELKKLKKSGDVALGGGIADGRQRYLVSMRLATAPKPALFNLQTHTSNSSLNMRRLPSSFH